MTSNILRIIRGFIACIIIAILLASTLLEILPTLPNSLNSVVNAIHLTNQQYALAERISKDVLTLTQPGSDHSQAILELQVTLPAFEKNQNGLQTNDPSLGLPAHIPGDIQLLIIQSQADYVALDSAARSILKNADPPIDPNQLAIILQHERPYFIAMNTIAKVWQGHIEQNAFTFFQVELGFGIGLLVLVIVHFVLGRIVHKLSHHQQKEQSS